jgi:hypothetical protein
VCIKPYIPYRRVNEKAIQRKQARIADTKRKLQTAKSAAVISRLEIALAKHEQRLSDMMLIRANILNQSVEYRAMRAEGLPSLLRPQAG